MGHIVDNEILNNFCIFSEDAFDTSIKKIFINESISHKPTITFALTAI